MIQITRKEKNKLKRCQKKKNNNRNAKIKNLSHTIKQLVSAFANP